MKLLSPPPHLLLAGAFACCALFLPQPCHAYYHHTDVRNALAGQLLPPAAPNQGRLSPNCQDPETDPAFHGYRYYNASTGRWLSRDPIDELRLRLPPPGENIVGSDMSVEDDPATWHLLADLPQQNLYTFVLNTPACSIDHLGLVKIPGIPCGTCLWRCSEYSRTPEPRWSKSRGGWTSIWIYKCWQRGFGCVPPPNYKSVVTHTYVTSPAPTACPRGMPTSGSY
jgi:hypothetical protein